MPTLHRECYRTDIYFLSMMKVIEIFLGLAWLGSFYVGRINLQRIKMVICYFQPAVPLLPVVFVCLLLFFSGSCAKFISVEEFNFRCPLILFRH